MNITKIEVHGDSNKTYEIKFDAKGRVYCTCPAFRFMKAPIEKRVCKHMKFAAEATV